MNNLPYQEIKFRRACISEILGLRHRILRPGLPEESAVFDGDILDDTLHFCAFRTCPGEGENLEILSCVSFMLVPEYSLQSKMYSLQLQMRGMATETSLQKMGVGRNLLLFAESAIGKLFGKRIPVWCNARQEAVPFYEQNGWIVTSDIFDIPGVGPHKKMRKVFNPS